ncbi:MAG: hypothetical protein HPZ91_14410 [Lentisphaeria bacterium]|nr:hypothetical protein [Lentisphaeria bacterium]
MTKTIDLANPPAEYRPIPFWSWNDKLDLEELRRQVREMKAAGLGGFFMHARGGLQTAYLSDEWMECVKACLDEAGKCGIAGWLYDENGWPSGFGGGLVNGLGVKYQQKYLRFEYLDAADLEASERENTIAWYDAATLELLGEKLPDGTAGRLLRCYYEVNPYYVDNLDPKVVREFLKVTHKHYYDNLPKELLRHMKGIFTDEPQLSRKGLLWSFVLEEEYWKAYHCELLKELPMLFLGTPQSDAVRIRFWSLVARLFSENFMKQLHDWCEAKGWQLTGHHVLEETCQAQISSNGSIMPQYRYYHIPGMDHLCRTEPSPVAMVQLVSAAMQFGQKQILSESFALSGWNINFFGLRWMFQQQFAHGVNLVCPHLSSYTLRGLRKRDYPASLFVHQPWWSDYRSVNDYFARAGMLLAEGRGMAEVLVLHPLSSAWCHYAGNESNPALNYYTETLKRLTVALDAHQIAHHYADEQIVAAGGSFEKGKIRIGLQSYGYVVIPQITNLSKPMLALLREFAAAGGRILTVRNRLEPEKLTVDGEAASAEIRNWFRALPAFDSEQAAADAAAAELAECRTVVTENGVPATRIVSTFRDFDELDGRGGRFFFMANVAYNQPCHVHISLPRNGGRQVEVIDPATGTFSILSGVHRSGEHLSFDYAFAAGAAAMFFVAGHPAKHAGKVTAEDPFRAPAKRQLPNLFALAGAVENILTLDRCRYRVDGGGWITDDVSVIQGRLLALERDCDLEIEYSFDIDGDFDLATPLTMAVETPEAFSFALNGVPFEGTDSGYLFDRAFRRIALPAGLRTGRNVIYMKMRYHQDEEVYARLQRALKFETEYNMLTYDTEVESIYLCGDFSCRHTGRTEPLLRGAERLHGSFSLGAGAAGKTVEGADLVPEGFPFFAGKVTLRQEFELTASEAEKISMLRFVPVGANSYRIRLNNEEAGVWSYGFAAFPVGHLVHAGKNTLEIELTTSLRNMLGPHHLEEGESYAVNTLSFNREANSVGWKAPAYNPGYCMVKLGIADVELA